MADLRNWDNKKMTQVYFPTTLMHIHNDTTAQTVTLRNIQNGAGIRAGAEHYQFFKI